MPIINDEIEEVLLSLSKSTSCIPVNSKEVIDEVNKAGLIVSDIIIRRICSSLNSGKHLILTGPPGTAKTTLAKIIARVAQKSDPIFTTASSDWSVSDTLGSYMPDTKDPRKLKFETGIILQSIIDRKWIILDEINRAQIDKCLGPLFSLLSDNAVELTYRNENTNRRIKIEVGNGENEEDKFFKVHDWRLIGTMNEYDKNSLFEMSSAFIRRFAIIPVGIPDNYHLVIKSWAKSINEEIVNNLQEIAEQVEQKKMREIGPALFKDIISYIEQRELDDSEHIMHYSEALVIFLLPQFQGLDEYDAEALKNITKKILQKDNEALKYFIDSLKSYIG